MDWQGQKLVEQLMQILLLSFAMVAFLIVYVLGSIQTMLLILEGYHIQDDVISIEESEFPEDDGGGHAFLDKYSLSRAKPTCSGRFYWEDVDRQLVVKYASNRAALGEKFNHVDWEKLQNLSALLGAKLASLASLQSELQLFHEKRSFNAKELIAKANVHAVELERQIDVLRRETKAQNKKKDTLEISTNEAKEKILELNLKLEKWFQEEMIKAKLEAASFSKQLEEVLLGMLHAYYNHVRAFENTLVTKFFGLYCVKMTGPTLKKVCFVKMGNLFCTEYAIHRCFDLKGSSHGRLTEKAESQIDSTTTLKDLDLNFIFRLQKVWFQEFCRVHFREVSGSGEPVTTNKPNSRVLTLTANAERSSDVSMSRISRDDMDLLFDPSGWASIRLGINMAAKAELTMRRSDFKTQLVGDPTGQYYDVIQFFVDEAVPPLIRGQGYDPGYGENSIGNAATIMGPATPDPN
ncbi:Phosphatidylinositol 4-phosphate 5-kinase 6 [Capsicum baccatum]|uniref:1-phosphatidylinositol-4-phosphate 5-kinase n=1 Tax=Capsicum baccatum TaxID=33114 RepID=A0A2G2XC14_CAPBA|nr:Phosphatidylinositol 4-phosphate 5-kinase 6 [Capsicum baccatum]